MNASAAVQGIAFLDGGEVAIEVLQAINYRTELKSATIVSYNMQDYTFWDQGNLSHLLLSQLAHPEHRFDS